MTASQRTASRGTVNLPTLHDYENWKDAMFALWVFLGQILAGKLNCTAEVTFTASAATTVVKDQRVGAKSYIGIDMPLTANAAGELGYYVSSQGTQTFTITHAVDSRSDRTFRYVVIG